MLSYRHAFHAGNHADVFKHWVLRLLLRRLLKKQAPICYLDTHAGGGGYDLRSREALKNAEYGTGIGKLWERDDLPESVTDYLAAVRAFNGPGPLRSYPGSPWIAADTLRPQDRLILCELHPSEQPLLKATFRGDKRVNIHALDGFQGLKAFVPPKEKRLLVLIDPPYEQAMEYNQVVAALAAVHKRWPGGIYTLWYPVLERHATETFIRHLRDTRVPNLLRIELNVRDDHSGRGMRGSGLVIANSPWQTDNEIETTLPHLWQALASDGGCRVEWLTGEVRP